MLNKVIDIAIALTVLFILLGGIVVDQWNTAGAKNVSGTGISTGTYQGILLIIFVLAMFGVVYAFRGKSK